MSLISIGVFISFNFSYPFQYNADLSSFIAWTPCSTLLNSSSSPIDHLIAFCASSLQAAADLYICLIVSAEVPVAFHNNSIQYFHTNSHHFTTHDLAAFGINE
jgi:hypothetical protein